MPMLKLVERRSSLRCVWRSDSVALSFEQPEPLTSGGFVQSPSRPRLLAEEFALRAREERQHSEDEMGRHPQASARPALESLDGLLARIDSLPLVGGGQSRHPDASGFMNSGTASRRKSISSAAMLRDSRSK
jgi:hypothetical protein